MSDFRPRERNEGHRRHDRSHRAPIDTSYRREKSSLPPSHYPIKNPNGEKRSVSHTRSSEPVNISGEIVRYLKETFISGPVTIVHMIFDRFIAHFSKYEPSPLSGKGPKLSPDARAYGRQREAAVFGEGEDGSQNYERNLTPPAMRSPRHESTEEDYTQDEDWDSESESESESEYASAHSDESTQKESKQSHSASETAKFTESSRISSTTDRRTPRKPSQRHQGGLNKPTSRQPHPRSPISKTRYSTSTQSQRRTASRRQAARLRNKPTIFNRPLPRQNTLTGKYLARTNPTASFAVQSASASYSSTEHRKPTATTATTTAAAFSVAPSQSPVELAQTTFHLAQQERRQIPAELQVKHPDLQTKLQQSPQLLNQLTNYVAGTFPPGKNIDQAVNDLMDAAKAADITNEELRDLIDNLFEDFNLELLDAELTLQNQQTLLLAESSLNTISPQARELAKKLPSRLQPLTTAHDSSESTITTSTTSSSVSQSESATNVFPSELDDEASAAQEKASTGNFRSFLNWLTGFWPFGKKTQEPIEESYSTASTEALVEDLGEYAEDDLTAALGLEEENATSAASTRPSKSESTSSSSSASTPPPTTSTSTAKSASKAFVPPSTQTAAAHQAATQQRIQAQVRSTHAEQSKETPAEFARRVSQLTASSKAKQSATQTTPPNTTPWTAAKPLTSKEKEALATANERLQPQTKASPKDLVASIRELNSLISTAEQEKRPTNTLVATRSKLQARLEPLPQPATARIPIAKPSTTTYSRLETKRAMDALIQQAQSNIQQAASKTQASAAPASETDLSKELHSALESHQLQPESAATSAASTAEVASKNAEIQEATAELEAAQAAADQRESALLDATSATASVSDSEEEFSEDDIEILEILTAEEVRQREDAALSAKPHPIEAALPTEIESTLPNSIPSTPATDYTHTITPEQATNAKLDLLRLSPEEVSKLDQNRLISHTNSIIALRDIDILNTFNEDEIDKIFKAYVDALNKINNEQYNTQARGYQLSRKHSGLFTFPALLNARIALDLESGHDTYNKWTPKFIESQWSNNEQRKLFQDFAKKVTQGISPETLANKAAVIDIIQNYRTDLPKAKSHTDTALKKWITLEDKYSKLYPSEYSSARDIVIHINDKYDQQIVIDFLVSVIGNEEYFPEGLEFAHNNIKAILTKETHTNKDIKTFTIQLLMEELSRADIESILNNPESSDYISDEQRLDFRQKLAENPDASFPLSHNTDTTRNKLTPFAKEQLTNIGILPTPTSTTTSSSAIPQIEATQANQSQTTVPPGYSGMPLDTELTTNVTEQPPTSPNPHPAQLQRENTVFAPLMPNSQRLRLYIEDKTGSSRSLTDALNHPEDRQEILRLILDVEPEALTQKHLQVLDLIAQKDITPNEAYVIANTFAQLAYTNANANLISFAKNYITVILANAEKYPSELRTAARLDQYLIAKPNSPEDQSMVKALEDPQTREKALNLILRTPQKDLTLRHLNALILICQKDLKPEDCNKIASCLTNLAASSYPPQKLALSYLQLITTYPGSYNVNMQPAVMTAIEPHLKVLGRNLQTITTEELSMLNNIATLKVDPSVHLRIGQALTSLSVLDYQSSANAKAYIGAMLADTKKYPQTMRETVATAIITRLNPVARQSLKVSIEKYNTLATAASALKSYSYSGTDQNGNPVYRIKNDPATGISITNQLDIFRPLTENPQLNALVNAGKPLPEIPPISQVILDAASSQEQPQASQVFNENEKTTAMSLLNFLFAIPPFPQQ